MRWVRLAATFVVLVISAALASVSLMAAGLMLVGPMLIALAMSLAAFVSALYLMRADA